MSTYQIEKNANNINDTLLINIIKMLTEREYLDKDKLDANIKKILATKHDDKIYIVDLIKPYRGTLHKTLAVKIIFQKITGINKSFGAPEFLSTYKDTPKIIIVEEIGKKVAQHISKNAPNTEIFLQEELMINIIDHEIVPKHILLSQEDRDMVLNKYNVKKKEMPKIYNSDPIARYYNMQPGDICKIIRPSTRCGQYPTYRLVIKASIN